MYSRKKSPSENARKSNMFDEIFQINHRMFYRPSARMRDTIPQSKISINLNLELLKIGVIIYSKKNLSLKMQENQICLMNYFELTK